jgi:uncharacterized protein with PQ loop repeat
MSNFKNILEIIFLFPILLRFIAVTQPIKYARHKNSKRIFLMLAFVWFVSFAIAAPICAGMLAPKNSILC